VFSTGAFAVEMLKLHCRLSLLYKKIEISEGAISYGSFIYWHRGLGMIFAIRFSYKK
jgi:hypothetical protein